MAGGYPSKFGQGSAGNNFWRFDPDAGAWEILPDLPKARAAGAAVYMHGRVWVVGGVGAGAEINLQSYDVRTGEWELFSGASGRFASHIQAVAFENEIWWLAGRTANQDSTTNTVQIWNPVSREWRAGPPMNHARGGHAAGLVQGQIIVVGGEVIEIPGLTWTLEVFAPGADSWVFGPSSPVSVHGTTGAVVNGELVLIAGSDIAGEVSRNRATQVLRPATAANPVESPGPGEK